MRINLVGREPHGLVQPGQEYEELIEHLIEEFHQLVDGRSGKPMVAEVIRSRDLDLGGSVDDWPDLIVRWALTSSVSIESPTVGSVHPVYSSRKGEHDVEMTGFFFATGPEVLPGVLDHPAKMEDFAPTIASLLGMSLDETDGTPIAEICGSHTR